MRWTEAPRKAGPSIATEGSVDAYRLTDHTVIVYTFIVFTTLGRSP